MKAFAPNTLPAEFFRRQDDRDDTTFYSMPRKVVHVDDHAIAAIRSVYARLLPAEGTILDLMSSWRSHLPTDINFDRVVGLGMNAAEMNDNPQLDDYTIHDLNRNPVLPYADHSFDGVVCAVSVQYMTAPLRAFAEVNRILRPGAPFVVTFSNRCFPTKAVDVWLRMNAQGHRELVRTYFEMAGNYTDVDEAAYPGERGLFSQKDPLYAVWGCKAGC